MEVSVELNGSRRPATIVFAGRNDLTFANDWRKTLAGDENPLRKDAVDFAQVAVHRFEAHSEIQPYAKSIEDINDHIQNNPKIEVACLVLLKCDWFPESPVIGIVHFRRTWCNRTVLDYLAVHPFIVRPSVDYPDVVRGVGSTLLNFLCTVATTCGCDAIWGEATQGSCDFYKKVFKLESVEDFIYAPRANFLEFVNNMIANSPEESGETATVARDEIYAAEVANPPFVGSTTAVFSPTRRLAYRFLGLPTHSQREIIETFNVLQDENSAQPIDEQFTRLFQWAAENGKLSALWQQVEEKYLDGEPDNNPFLTL